MKGVYPYNEFKRDEKKAQSKEKKELERLKALYRKVFDNPEGREVLWDIFGMSRMFSSSYDGAGNTDFNEGKRAVGLELLAKINMVDINLFIKMLQERSK